MEPRLWRGRVVEATNRSIITDRFTEAPKQQKMITNRKAAKPKMPAPNVTAAPKPASVNTRQKAAPSIKTTADKETTTLVVTTHPTSSPLEGNTDLLSNLPAEAYVQLTRRLLMSISYLPTGGPAHWQS